MKNSDWYLECQRKPRKPNPSPTFHLVISSQISYVAPLDPSALGTIHSQLYRRSQPPKPEPAINILSVSQPGLRKTSLEIPRKIVSTIESMFQYYYDTGTFLNIDAIGRGTVLQAGRSRVPFPIMSWNISLTYSFRPHCGCRVDSTSNRNEYQEYFL